MNNKAVGYLLTFVLGAAGGSFITWRYLKNTYEELTQEEINSVKATYEKLKDKVSEEKQEQKIAECRSNDISEKPSKKPDIVEYSKLVRKAGYKNYSDTISKDIEEEKEMRPYVISPDEYGENEEYERISLTYYSNNILTDENDDIIEDVDETVGIDSLTHFGEYEDDSVFVRNDARRCDYEILLDQSPYDGESR